MNDMLSLSLLLPFIVYRSLLLDNYNKRIISLKQRILGDKYIDCYVKSVPPSR